MIDIYACKGEFARMVLDIALAFLNVPEDEEIYAVPPGLWLEMEWAAGRSDRFGGGCFEYSTGAGKEHKRGQSTWGCPWFPDLEWNARPQRRSFSRRAGCC